MPFVPFVPFFKLKFNTGSTFEPVNVTLGVDDEEEVTVPIEKLGCTALRPPKPWGISKFNIAFVEVPLLLTRAG